MKKTDKKKLEEFIRVDHAGERGAIKIYEGQLLALNTFVKNDDLKRTIEEMKKHEVEHAEYFENEIKKKKYQTHKGFTSLGFARCRSRFWFDLDGTERCNALYCIC